MARRITPTTNRLGNSRKFLFSRFSMVKERVSYGKTVSFIQRRPFASFFLALGLLFLLILMGSTIFAPRPVDEKKADAPKQVETFKIGSAPRVTVQGEVEKSGVIKIVAQTPGVVTAINVIEGQQVGKGAQLISLSSNYQGGNAAAIQAQLAQNQYKLAKDTFEAQKDLINKQQEIARKTDSNADELRDISARSIDETRGLLDLNQSLLDQINANIDQLEQQTPSATTSAAIAQAQGQQAQLQAAVNQLRSGLRQGEYQASGDKPPAQLSDLGREIALKQLEVQEKTLEAGKETARLSAALAWVQSSLMFPSAPFSGLVERVHVRLGEAVNPGATLVTLSGDVSNITVVAYVPQSVAQNVSHFEESELTVDGKTIMLMPSYITTEAINGQLYGVIFQLGDEYRNLFTDSSFVEVRVPFGTGDTSSITPSIPVDAVFQTQEEAYVFVEENGVARSRKITLGKVQGGFVGVEEGLIGQETVIVSRNVIDGDRVTDVTND